MKSFHSEHVTCMHNSSKGRKVALGLIILSLGFVFLFDNLGILPQSIKSVVISWPMLLVAIGIINLFGRNSYFAGLIMIVIGLFFITPRLFDFAFNFTSILWPVLLIIIGLLIIFRKGLGRSPKPDFEFNQQNFDDPESTIDEVNVFGGSKHNIISQNFKGGKITSIFGGTELDFTNAQLAEGTNFLEMVCIFGGASIILPSDWVVRSEVVSILGGFADQRKSVPRFENNGKLLVIKGVAIFGGGEIKSIKS